MKRRMGWFSVVAATSLALTALVAFTGAPTASAATETHLCVHVPAGNGDFVTECIYAPTTVGDNAEMGGLSDSTTNWTYPANGATGEIKQANVNLCLQVNASAGGIIRGAACTNDEAEIWGNAYNPSTKRTVFLSEWYLNDEGTPEDMCLSEQPSPLVGVDSCAGNNADNWYLQWGSS
jgi:hypothetical protein